METPIGILKKYWGYDKFRPLQEDIVKAVIAGKDVLALLPTGGGKSVCFQVPALAKEGICIVISPLIALMKDQVEQLKRRGISAAAIYSGMGKREIDITLDNCIYGGIKFLYVSPERLKTELFIERAKQMNISFLAVDEAHCISQWGYDFRPAYVEIAAIKEILPIKNVIALTATATPLVRKDILDKLQIPGAELFVKSFARDNLSYSVFEEEDKDKKLLEVLRSVKGSAVVYSGTRKKTKELAIFLYKSGISADFYHGGLNNEERAAKQDAWIQNQTRVMVATNAFGMGIDKPDVRVVVHMDLPQSLEAYYQEAGRGGRDERKAYAVLLWQEADIELLQKRIYGAYPPVEIIRKVYQALANYYKLAVGSGYMESYDFELTTFAHQYDLNPLTVFQSLSQLEEEGVLQLNEGFHAPSQVYIKLSHQELYKFQIAQANYDPIIKVMLRIYGGELFSSFMAVAESKIAALLQKSVNDTTRLLQGLHDREVIIYQPRKDKPQLTFLQPRHDQRTLPIDQKRIEARKAVAVEKMKAMIDYTRHEHRCRTQLLLEYFGEVNYNLCGVCDYCVKRRKEVMPEDTQPLRAAILRALDAAPLLPPDLVDKLPDHDRDEVLLTLRQMLDSDEVKYNAAGEVLVTL